MSGFGPLLTALVDTFAQAAPASVGVWDGQAYDPQTADYLCVGWDESDQPSVSLTSTPASVSGAQDWDTFDISNLLTCQTGDPTQLAQLRTEAESLFDTFRDAIRSDPSLGGAAVFARVSAAEYAFEQRVTGLTSLVRFTVTATAQ